MLEIKEVTKDYYIDHKPFSALKGVSLSFPDEQFAAVLGPSGCGKTTLLNLIGGLDSISQGDILYGGKSLKAMKDKELDSYRNNVIGFIYQNYYLIPQLTVLENIEVALAVRDYSKKEIEEKALAALKEVGVSELSRKKPNQLSGGQAQRVAIARAIVTDPSILLADEPTGALDSENSTAVMDVLKSVSAHRLVILVTHNETLARTYSQRLIRLADGKVKSDEMIAPAPSAEQETRPLRKSRLSFGMRNRLAGRNIVSKKWKTVLSAIANSFGMIGIGFFLAINNGFSAYSNRLSQSTASSLPVVVTAYNQTSTSEVNVDRSSSNLYPSATEVYPSVDLTSSVTYQANNFSTKYFHYLDSLKSQGIVKDYTLSYGNDYSFNLMTSFPASLDGKTESKVSSVYTYLNWSYNYYAYQADLPYNIFHVLYGDLNQYDVLSGSLPTGKDDLVLVVDKYNSVGFGVLQQLGFYSRSDSQSEVKVKDDKDPQKFTVKPISFADIVGKEYKVFENDELYSLSGTTVTNDGNGNLRTLTSYEKNTDLYSDATKGQTLKITGIIRPKANTSFTMLAPSLCYSKELQEELAPKNLSSTISTTIKDNAVLIDPKKSGKPIDDFTSEMDDIYQKYKKGEYSSSGTILPLTDLNAVFNKYFQYTSVFGGDPSAGLTLIRSEARSLGIDLVPDSLRGVDLTSSDTLEKYIQELQDLYSTDVNKAYDLIIGLNAYLNAYSVVDAVVIFPIDLANRTTLLSKLDSFNDIQSDSEDHASSSAEVVRYAQENDNEMVKDVAEMVSLVSTILVIYAAVTLTVACVMMALMTSNNVLERRTEIGLLRSLGSRKKDIALLFETESFAVGLLSGLIGSLLTYLFSIPINSLINSYYPWYEIGTICDFTGYHVLILVAIAIAVSLLSALIPALKASKERPVDCLRSD
jgi:putative ABC transport system permease protein